MTNLVRAEFRKLTSTRMWLGLTLGGLGLLALYITIVALTAGNTRDAGRNALPALSNPASVRTVYGLAFQVGYLMPLILGVMVICGEFRHRTITPTFLVTPRRGRVLVAKAIAAGVAGLLMGILFAGFGAALGASLIAARGYPVLLTSNDIPRMFGLMILGLGVWCIFGLGFGALLKNQIAAVVTAIALMTIVEGLLSLFLDWVNLDTVAQFLPSNASAAIVQPANLRGTELLDWWAGALVLLGWGVVTAALGSFFTLRRDVT